MIEENNLRPNFIRGSFGLPRCAESWCVPLQCTPQIQDQTLPRSATTFIGFPSPLIHKYFRNGLTPF